MIFLVNDERYKKRARNIFFENFYRCVNFYLNICFVSFVAFEKMQKFYFSKFEFIKWVFFFFWKFVFKNFPKAVANLPFKYFFLEWFERTRISTQNKKENPEYVFYHFHHRMIYPNYKSFGHPKLNHSVWN